jgi:hypothetical protein
MPPSLKMTKEEKKIFEEDTIKIKTPKPKKSIDKQEVKKLEQVIKRELKKKTETIPDNREIIIDISTTIKYKINWFVLRRKLKILIKTPWILYSNWFNNIFNNPLKKSYGRADVELSTYFEDDDNEPLYENLPTIPELTANEKLKLKALLRGLEDGK